MATKFLYRGFIGCTTVLGIGLVAVILSLILWGWSNSEKKKELAENISLTIDSPRNVESEEEFVINVYIKNKSSKDYKLRDIDVPSN